MASVQTVERTSTAAITDPSVSIRNLDLSFGAVKVLENLNLDIGKGEFLVLLGSSGCGKSTLLNCIAGLLDLTGGQIWIGGKNVTWAEPSERGIGMVFQSYALYPQMTVEGNLSFGLRNAKMPKAEIAKRVKRAAEILQIEPLLKRKPGALSGGQRQRVAIGRALVRDAEVFLFDEPLSNLDAKLRADLRVEIKQLHERLDNTMIYVTHDQVEAMTLADRVAIMRGGLILQLGTPNEIYHCPQSKYVAGFIGSPAMNFIEGTLQGGFFDCPLGRFSMEGYAFADTPRDGPAWLGIRPEHIAPQEIAASKPIQLEARVELVDPLGSETLARVRVGDQQLWVKMDGETQIAARQSLPIGFSPERVHLFDKQSEVRL